MMDARALRVMRFVYRRGWTTTKEVRVALGYSNGLAYKMLMLLIAHGYMVRVHRTPLKGSTGARTHWYEHNLTEQGEDFLEGLNHGNE